MPTLQLKGVVLQSPGFWEFLGKLNPLEVLRLYLNDRHNRIKDVTYRNRLEEEKFAIDNALGKIKLLSDYVDVAKKAGLTETEVANILRDNAHIPLLRLNALQDKGIISYAEIASKKTNDVLEEIDA